ncbi:MAG: Gfo/Idh/MocA family oxidoreductase [Thermodesulfobacteriota bacterium]
MSETASQGGAIKVAVVGAGYWGKNLVRNFHQLGALALVCDRSEELLAQTAQQYSGVDTCLALSEVTGRKDIAAAVIATPAETHYALAKECLLAGKHVFVEKPLVLRESEGQELIDLAQERGLVIMVGHLLQYHPVFVRLKQMVSAGELGRINYIYSNRLNLGKIRREENILWSFAPHDISMILSLAGELPEVVFATGGNYLHQRIADVTTTHLEFPSGLKAHIFVSWLHPFKDQRLVVVGDGKMAVFDDTLAWADKLLIYPHQIKWDRQVPIAAKAQAERVDIPQSEPLRAECEHFLASVAAGSPPLTDGREGLNVLMVLNAAQRSLTDRVGHIPGEERSDLAKLVKGMAEEIAPPYFAHETAIVDDGCEIGEGAKIWHFSHVLKGSRVGKGCNIGQNVVIGPDVNIGEGCKIQNNVSVYKGVTLEDDVFCGPSMVFTNVHNPRAFIRRMDEIRPTLVRQGASLGANCTIVCGHTVGAYAFVGAGAVVTKDVPDHALMVGNPARRMGWMCRCGVKLDAELACAACGDKYQETATGLVRL